MKTEIKTLREAKGSKWLDYALIAFAGLGIELLYLLGLEPMIYRILGQDFTSSFGEWSDWQIIFHWVITSVTWGGITWLLIYCARSRYGTDVLKRGERVSLRQWSCVAVCFILLLINSFLTREGFKVLKEFQGLGLLRFIFQYIYYFFETGLFVLIIVFGQLAFEKWIHKGAVNRIPYGGILLAVTWGLVHALTKGSLLVGLDAAFCSMVFGIVYLLLNRNYKLSYAVLFLMFIL